MADPTRKENLHVLAARAGAGETGQKFTAEIVAAVVGAPAVEQSRLNGRWCIYDDQGRLWQFAKEHDALAIVFRHDMDLSKSLDAQAALPGRVVSIRWHWDAKQWRASVENQDRYSFAPTEPLARLAAKLRAMAAQEDGDG